MRLAISAGHGNQDPGAVNAAHGLIEHVEAYRIAWLLRDVLERGDHSVEFISCFQTLGEKISQVNRLHAERRVDLAIEIHFNSSTSTTARGTEVLHYSPKNEALALLISHAISRALGTRDRGAVKRDNLGWLKRTDPPALILEVLFLSNDLEAQKIGLFGFHQTVAQAIAEALN